MKYVLFLTILASTLNAFAGVKCKAVKSIEVLKGYYSRDYYAVPVNDDPYYVSHAKQSLFKLHYEYRMKNFSRRTDEYGGIGHNQHFLDHRILGTNIYYEPETSCNAAPGFTFLCALAPVYAYDTAKVEYDEELRELTIFHKFIYTEELSEWELSDRFEQEPVDRIIVYKDCK